MLCSKLLDKDIRKYKQDNLKENLKFNEEAAKHDTLDQTEENHNTSLWDYKKVKVLPKKSSQETDNLPPITTANNLTTFHSL